MTMNDRLHDKIEELTDELERLEHTLRNFGFTDIELDAIRRGKRFGKIMSEGATRILKERIRQIEVEGWDADHDDEHDAGDLAVMAAGLAVYGTDAYIEDPAGRIERDPADIRDAWGLIQKHKDNPTRMLEIAGALIAAELDRVLRGGE